jgi:hypothetical protein
VTVSRINYVPAVEFSRRYFLLGIYKDRKLPVWRIYVPFVRISFGVRDYRRANAK